jgi:hypothetical protein
MRGVRRTVLLAAVLLTACGSSGRHGPVRSTSGEPRYEADVTILENASHGPQACFQVLTSLPPQCGGPDLRNFSWSDVHPMTRNGVRWVEAHVVGTWSASDSTLTLTEKPRRPRDAAPPAAVPPAPCPEPAGGWRVVDPTKASQADLDAARQLAMSKPEYAGEWIDQSTNPMARIDPAKITSTVPPAPPSGIWVVAFTGNLTQYETELRARWGGRLCVVKHEHTDAELQAIVSRLFTPEAKQAGVDVSAASPDPTRDAVAATVMVPDDRAQRWVDETFGRGVVILEGALKPVP